MPAAERPAGLEVGGVDAVVADVRVGERDDLPGVRRVGDDLLVAGQRRVEHDLAAGDPARRLGADRLALEHRPVGEHQSIAVLSFAIDRLRAVPNDSSTRTACSYSLPYGYSVTDDGVAAEHACAAPARGGPAGVRGVAAAAGRARPARTVQVSSGSKTVRFAGRPGSIGPPWRSATPAIAAGFHDSAATTSASGMSSSAQATPSAVSRPSIPGGASSIGRSLASAGCGAWSVAMASIVPSASPALIAATSAAVRSGGLTLNTGS